MDRKEFLSMWSKITQINLNVHFQHLFFLIFAMSAASLSFGKKREFLTLGKRKYYKSFSLEKDYISLQVKFKQDQLIS